ncbi:MAG: hypothetical protein WEA58_10815 [Balneolaceae bacterium]
MKNIVLIEDKLPRMEFLCKEKELNLTEIKELTIISDSKFESLKKSIGKSEFNLLEGFKAIMSHHSAWSQKELDSIKEYCKKTNTVLILFSGGISVTHLRTSKPQVLLIDVERFYSNRLILFIDAFIKSEELNLPILQYGKNWKINVLMETRNNLAVFLSRNPGIEVLDYYEESIKLPQALYSISDEFELDLSWYENGIRQNAYQVLTELNKQLTSAIKKVLFQ